MTGFLDQPPNCRRDTIGRVPVNDPALASDHLRPTLPILCRMGHRALHEPPELLPVVREAQPTTSHQGHVMVGVEFLVQDLRWATRLSTKLDPDHRTVQNGGIQCYG